MAEAAVVLFEEPPMSSLLEELMGALAGAHGPLGVVVAFGLPVGHLEELILLRLTGGCLDGLLTRLKEGVPQPLTEAGDGLVQSLPIESPAPLAYSRTTCA